MNPGEHHVGKSSMDDQALARLTHAQAMEMLSPEQRLVRLRLLFDSGKMKNRITPIMLNYGRKRK